MPQLELPQLGQAQPSDTAAVSLYSPELGEEVKIFSLWICNVTGSPADYSVFIDDDGTDYDEGTAVRFEKELAANDSVNVFAEGPVSMNNENGNLAIQSGTGSALTYTLSGMIVK